MNKPATFPRSLELVPVGDAVGVVLPAELLEQLGLTVGDHVQFASTAAGFAVEPDREGLAAQIGAARDVMRRRRAALAELAK